ncbi:MAG: HAMP domain-containing sensor histidine kinase [Cyanobacteriota bacterium]|nr:HAMP domain-containing sensor histidine kinase [Cyanobacteriota bacterium]
MKSENHSINSIGETPKSNEELRERIVQLEAEQQEMKKRHNLELQQLEQELSALKARFITTVSHEFRTPLTTISFSAGLLENYSAKISEAKKQTHFQRIKSGIEQMTSLLEDVLIVGKLEFGQCEMNLSSVNLEEIFHSSIEKVQSNTDKHQITLKVLGSNFEGLFDEILLKQLINNILSNAVKYSPKGGEVHCELLSENQQAILKVKDFGIGIPKLDQERVFSNFYRGTNIDTISGTGLGLSLVKKIVDLHDGEIEIESEENQGTLVQVSLPLIDKLATESQ